MKKLMLGYLDGKNIPYKRQVNLSRISSVKIGPVADTVIYPQSSLELVDVIKILKKLGIQAIIQGRLSNTLILNNEIVTPVISTSRCKEVRIDGKKVCCECGASLPWLSSRLSHLGLSGLEPLSGIPGSLGAGIVGNAGAFGRELSELVCSITVYDSAEDKTLVLTPSECGFGYRSSAISDRFTVLSAELIFKESTEELVLEEINRVRTLRNSTQPTDKPSLGSVFKRTRLGSAARLIDECGLKGVSIGGAQVSEKHAGFIVNSGCATASDYVGLMYLVRKCVFEKFGVLLSPEIKIIQLPLG